MATKKDFLETIEKAKKILEENLYEIKLNGVLYRRTIPSKEFYVHQWNWDSATHAMALVHIDENRAFDELFSLVSGQWKNGLIPQIIFNPKEKKYFPGPRFWRTEKFRNGEIITSGITQPPLLGISFSYVFQKGSLRLKKRLEKQILPKIIKYHQYLKTYRDPEDSGLLTIIHPWESGTDNTPRWDKPLERIKPEDIPDQIKRIVNRYRSDDKIGDVRVRPEMKDYYRYMYLVFLFADWGWDYQRIVKESPFRVKDILFNSLWAKANEDLAQVLISLKKEKQAKIYLNWAEKTKKAIRACWQEKEKIFADFDVVSSCFIKENTIASFVALWPKIAREKELKLLLVKLKDKNQFWPCFPVPTTSINSKKFDPFRYWRGPVWPITNLFVIEGLNRYLKNKVACQLKEILINKTLSMIKRQGFFEYYHPLLGYARSNKKPLGFGSFSWTAAVFIYLFYEYVIGDSKKQYFF